MHKHLVLSYKYFYLVFHNVNSFNISELIRNSFAHLMNEVSKTNL
nr:MAG TPA: Mannosyl-oligosaccharide 1,2-alpha-mannosidase IA [Caudoviricetes sp.]